MSILLPVGIQLLEFKSKAEMSHVPQSQEALQFGRDTGSLGEPETEDVMQAVRETSHHCFFLLVIQYCLDASIPLYHSSHSFNEVILIIGCTIYQNIS